MPRRRKKKEKYGGRFEHKGGWVAGQWRVQSEHGSGQGAGRARERRGPAAFTSVQRGC